MSDSSVIPKDIQWFLLNNIDSIAQLEGLLLLHSDIEQQWTLNTIAKRLYISESDVMNCFNKLCDAGLLVSDSTGGVFIYKYSPASFDLHQMIERTATIYSHYLLAVTHLIHEKPKTRIQEFADAFLIRKD